MGYRLGSYKDMGGGGRASWLDNWKEAGEIGVWLHREPPWMRSVHNLRKIEIEEKDGRIKERIRWLPKVCWEDEDYHRQRRFGNSPRAQTCPVCKLVEWLEAKDDLPDDEVIFVYTAGRETKAMIKSDVIGRRGSAESFKSDITAQSEYLIAVIPDKKPDAVYIANERWSLGRSLYDRIERDIANEGADVGDPSARPILYRFEYNKGEPKPYNATSALHKKPPAKVLELWEGPSPDADVFVTPGDPAEIREAFEQGIQVDAPLDDFFADAVAAYKRRSEANGEMDFPPKEQPTAKSKTAQAKPPKKAPKEKKQRKTRATKTELPKPPLQPDLEVFECDSCGADWPEDVPACPKCGKEAAESAPPPEGVGNGTTQMKF